jgi:hypothetical protein
LPAKPGKSHQDTPKAQSDRSKNKQNCHRKKAKPHSPNELSSHDRNNMNYKL